MKIKYVGGRSRIDISFNRKPYYFTPENNRILDIKEPEVINYIFSLQNRAEFEAVVEPQEVVFNTENNTVSTIVTPIKKEKVKFIKSKKGRK